MKTPEEIAAKLIVERTWDRTVGVSGGAWTKAIADAIAAAERRGAEAMRLACVAVAREHNDPDLDYSATTADVADMIADAIRRLPLPGDKPKEPAHE